MRRREPIGRLFQNQELEQAARVIQNRFRGHEQNGIRFQNQTFNRYEHVLRFTFLYHNANIIERFEEMATQIRRRIQEFFQRGLHERHVYLLNFEPADERARHTLQRTIRTIAGITGEFLAAQYETMLHSDETLTLEGFRISVQIVGRLMRRRHGGGRARPFGAQMIPKYLKGMGLADHPLSMAQRKKNISATGPCGIRAILLARDIERYKKKWDDWINEAKIIGRIIGVEEMMKNEDFEKVLTIEEWKNFRIVIFGLGHNVEYSLQGVDWIWPDALPREQPDPKTLTILRDPVEKHYWWCQYPSVIAFAKGGNKGKELTYKNCHHCFRRINTDLYDDHMCSGIDTHQCGICMKFFVGKEKLQNHLSKKNDLFRCEVCNKNSFNGTECFKRHYDHNCKAPENSTVEKCEDCGRRYLNDNHDCNAWGSCKNCAKEFTTKEERSKHECYYQTLDKYWDPVTERQWEAHWFYDFETNRAQEIANEEYRHQVMGWTLNLQIMDDITENFISTNNIWGKLANEVEKVPFEFVKCGDGRIFGKGLYSFIYVVEKILVCNKKQFKWKPVLWAHNGSKFDVKFILDHYVNVENLDLAGDKYEEEYVDPIPEKSEEGTIKWVHKKFNGKRNVVMLNLVGSKILQMTVRGAKYRCSHAHFVAPLRSLTKMLDLPIDVCKGEFPYGRMKPENWGKTLAPPELCEYDVDSMTSDRRTEVINWFNDQLQEPWNFDEQFWSYLFGDGDVGCAAMIAYHKKAEEMHVELWRKYPDRLDKMVSPLSYSTAPGWALAMYRTWFLPENTIAILRPNEARFIRDTLRGGRTDKRCNWLILTKEAMERGDRMVLFDFVSLYPSAQKDSIHDTYYPIGRPWWLTWKGPCNNEQFIERLGNKTGFIKISCKAIKYATHPTLHRLGAFDEDDYTNKLLFENRDKNEETYASPEIIEAIESGEIEITHIHEGLLFEKGGDIFNDYVDFFYKLKEEASRKINGEVSNPGLRWLAKLLLNSLWGKLGQRSYHVKEWVEYAERHEYIQTKIESGEWELIHCIPKDEHRAHYEYRIVDDFNNLNNTAYQIACYVSMWGRVILHKKVLRQHGMRALYSDTDSAVIYLRAGDELPYTGEGLGELADEMPKLNKKKLSNPRIVEPIFVAPKTYSIKIEGENEHGETVADYKTVCKGFEPSYANSQFINHQAMKNLIFTKYPINAFLNGKRIAEEEVEKQRSIKGERRLTFKSSLARNEITPVEAYLQKTISGDYTKGRKHPYDPRFIAPFGSINPPTKDTFLNNATHFF